MKHDEVLRCRGGPLGAGVDGGAAALSPSGRTWKHHMRRGPLGAVSARSLVCSVIVIHSLPESSESTLDGTTTAGDAVARHQHQHRERCLPVQLMSAAAGVEWS
jgi:hypothetical protein